MNPAPEYVLARRVLLDASAALGSQRDAVVLSARRRSTSRSATATWPFRS